MARANQTILMWLSLNRSEEREILCKTTVGLLTKEKDKFFVLVSLQVLFKPIPNFLRQVLKNWGVGLSWILGLILFLWYVCGLNI